MKRLKLAIAVGAVLAASAALAQQPTTQPSTRQDTTRTAPPDSRTDSATRDNASRAMPDRNAASGTAATSTTNRSDEKFLKNFAQANAAEVETGKIAEQQAKNAEVKAYAKHMVDEHSKTIAKVEGMATKLGTDVKSEPDLVHKAKAALLDRKDGLDFDEAYMKAMVKDHEKVVEMLQEQIRDGQNANVKQLASQALPDVQKHLKLAQDLQAKVSNDGRTRSSSSRTDSSTTTQSKSSPASSTTTR
jgi:putative membrane protein